MFVGVVCAVAAQSRQAQAQALLPTGIGMVRTSYRKYVTPNETFNADGDKVSRSKQYSTDFAGTEMLKGSYGEDLKKLAGVIKEFDPATDGGLLGRLNLGQFNINIKAQIEAYVLALGMGITPWLSAYAAAPFMNVDISATPSFGGTNTALQIKSELGDAAHPQIQDGLTQASQVNVDTILTNMQASGYDANKWHWQARQFGDTRLGLFFDPLSYLTVVDSPHQVVLNFEVQIPTGYLEKDTILVDTDLGRGYWNIYGEVAERLQTTGPLWLGFVGAGAMGIPTTRQLRVPLNEDRLPTTDRSTKVTVNPGYDYDFKGGFGLDLGLFEPALHVRYEGHTRDIYSGSMPGNYFFVSKGTDYNIFSGEFALTLSTVQAYAKKEFAVPFLAKLVWRHPFSGKNKMADEYVELTLSSFFPTPWAPSL
jgi:hypothetical protein